MRSLPTDLLSDKVALRRYLRALRDGLSAPLRAEWSRTMARTLLELDCYQQSRTLLLYAPIRSEVDLLCLVEQALADGKQVAFPVSHMEDCTLTFHLISGMEELTEGTYGIREPREGAPRLEELSHALCLVPALAFDRQGYRLGYGKGFYDRFLADFDGASVGICFGDCLFDRLPRHPHDRRVDLILTEGGAVTPDEAD